MEFSEKEKSRIIRWQQRLLPFMIGILTVLTVFFFVASFIQLYYLHRRIEQSPELDLSPALSILKNEEQNTTRKNILDHARWETLSLLEKHAWQRRYHQANVSLMSRIWTKYLGFVTGMTLALVGATFILGKLRESSSRFDAESALWKFSITTASPGLFLALLGTILMVTAMVTHHEIEVKDGPLYTSAWTSSSDNILSSSTIPSPEPFESQNDDEIINEMMRELGEGKKRN